ncbi:trypsin-like serine peptidase [Nonomuraea polychroma]|uniref:trypsin-like serine peptidase n=1 Tax=Nonomuraea polychroma TaxID=46176 RepID=UPI003D90F626
MCSLDVIRNGKPYSGSGVLIGPRQVLTAAHVIYDKRGKRSDSICVTPARNRSYRPFGQFKGVAYSTRRDYRPDGEFDLAMITLDRDASKVRAKGHGGVRLGYWGEAHQTDLRPLKPLFLKDKCVTVCGYPIDKCDGKRHDPIKGCSKGRLGNTMWAHREQARFTDERPGFMHYAADTWGGQSGGPVWITRTDGRRSLVGVHIGSEQLEDETTGKRTPPINIGVHLNEENFALVQSWFWLGR